VVNDNRPSHLLPPNATRLERVLCDAFDTAGLSLLADAPRLLKTEPSPILLPWLASEWGLAGLVKYFPTLEDLIDAALPWLMERGTAAAVERALSWIGFDNVVIEEHGARLSLDLGRIPTAEELEDIVYLIVLSIPAHVDLYRLYHGYDLRPIGVSQPENLDEGLLDDDSGIWTTIDGEAVKLSFGMERAVQVNAGKGVFLYRRREDTAWSQTFYDDKFRLDVSAFGDEIVPNRLMTVEFLVGQQAGGINWHPPTLGRRINIARAALDFDDDVDVFGDLNHGFAGGVTVQRNPFMLSDSILDEHDYQIEHVFLDELFADDRGIRAVFDPRVRHPGARREDTAWSRTIYEDRFILSVSPFDGEVVPNRSLAAEFALSTRIGDVGGESYPLNGITIEANRGDAHLAPAIVVASLPSLPMSRLDAAA
jgi:hypothetical protein